MATFAAIGYNKQEQEYECKIVTGAIDKFYVPGAVFRGKGSWGTKAVSLAYIVEGKTSADKVKAFFEELGGVSDQKLLETTLRKLPKVHGLA